MSMLKEKLLIDNKTTPREIEVGTSNVVKTNDSWVRITEDHGQRKVKVEELNFAEWQKRKKSKY